MIKKSLLVISLFLGILSNAQQIQNGILETWTPTGPGYEEPNGFMTSNYLTAYGAAVSVQKTTSAHQGTFAAQITGLTANLGSGPENYPGVLGLSGDGSTMGIPYSSRPDSVVFWYKYVPENNDWGGAVAVLRSNGSEIGMGQFNMYQSQPTYARAAMAIDYSSSALPDTLMIAFYTSVLSSPQLNSVLTIDDIQLVFGAGAGLNNYSVIKQINAFPNPANESVQITSANVQTLFVYNSTGQLLEKLVVSGPNTTLQTRNYAEGIYIIKSDDGSATRFIVKH